MEPWTYSDYKKSIKRNVEYGTTTLGHSLGGATGFAQVELELRLEDHPEEIPMALVALWMERIRGEVFNAFARDEFYMAELKDALKPDKVAVVMSLLPEDQLEEFKQDLETVKGELARL